MRDIKTQEIIDSLLGKIPAGDEDNFLADCFSTDENAEKYERVREDLIENYLRGNLSKADAERFEKYFLGDRHHRELFEFAKTLRGNLAENKELASAAAAQTKKKPASAGSWVLALTALGVLIIIGSIGYVVLQPYFNQYTAHNNPTPTPTAGLNNTPTPIPIKSPITESPNVNSTNTPLPPSNKPGENNSPNRPNTNSTPIEAPTPHEIATIPEVTLGFVSMGGKDEVLTIKKEDKYVRIKIIGPLKGNYHDYKSVIIDSNNNPIILPEQLSKFQMETTQKGSKLFVFLIEAKLFKESGEYTFQMKATGEDGQEVILRHPVFKVVRKD